MAAGADGGGLDAAGAGGVLVACAVAAAGAFVVGLAVTAGLRWLCDRWGVAMRWSTTQRSPVVALFVVVAVRIVLGEADAQQAWAGPAADVADVAIIAIVGWLLLVVAQVIEQGALARFPERSLEDRRSRHVRTKVTLLRRITDAVIVTIVVGAILWTIPAVREIGVGIFASAGVVGIVFGLAAQTSLSNVFAGVQVAFTDGIRIDDIVELEGQWGRIEEITLTYVVVKVWDGTTLILPCTYFTTTPFRNWTHQGTATTGTVELGVDWEVPIGAVRAELQRVLARSPNWDHDKGLLHVEDASGPIVKLVAEVSAPDGNTIAPLRREVREALVTYLQREHADVLPREREEAAVRLLPPEPATLDRLRDWRRAVADDTAAAAGARPDRPSDEPEGA